MILRANTGKGQIKLGGNADAVVSNIGRAANVGVGVNNKGSAAPIMSYSFGVKGLYAGITLDGTVLMPRKECNTAFYGEEVTLESIIAGEVNAPDNADYKDIVKLLEVNSRISGPEKGHKMDVDDLTPLSTQELENNQVNEAEEEKSDTVDESLGPQTEGGDDAQQNNFDEE